MSKKSEPTVTSSDAQPAYVGDLLLNGTTVIEATTREELAEMVNDIPADCRYAVGAVGRKQDGSSYILRVDLTQKS